jgi:hypothetical protein
MTRQPENKENAEPKISKDELSEKELEKASGRVKPALWTPSGRSRFPQPSLM